MCKSLRAISRLISNLLAMSSINATTGTSSGPKNARIFGADGLRAIACLMVVWHHTSQKLNPDQSPGWLKGIHFLGMRGEVGVSLFFVLSGCLLSLPFWSASLAGEKLPRVRNYALNRAARIVPAYWLNLILATFVALWVFQYHINWWRLFSGLIFINSYNYKTFFPAELNGPLWSIGLEVSCYLLLPLIIFLIAKITRRFIPTFGLTVLTIILLQYLNPWIIKTFMTDSDLKGWQYGLIGGAKQWLPYWNVMTFFSQFLLGSLAALFIAWRRVKSASASKAFDFIGVIAILGAILLVSKRLTPGVPDSFTQQPYVSPFYAILMAITLASVANGIYVWKILDNRLFRWIAKISFGIYLWHDFVITYFERKIFTDYAYYGIHSPTRWFGISITAVAISLIIAAISWRFIESPILKAVHQKTKSKK